MKLKNYEFTVYGSLLREDNVVLNPCYFRVGYKCMAKSWKDALKKCYNYCYMDYILGKYHEDEYILLGVSHYSPIWCEWKSVDFNYIHKVIREDKFLKEIFWY